MGGKGGGREDIQGEPSAPGTELGAAKVSGEREFTLWGGRD